jgi:hypothetical protein
VSEWQLNQLTDKRQLPANTTNIIISNQIRIHLLILSLDRVSFTMNNGILSNDAIRFGITLYNLELDRTHGATHDKLVALSDRTVSLDKVWLEVYVKEVTSHTLDRVIDGKDVDALSVLDIRARVDLGGVIRGLDLRT